MAYKQGYNDRLDENLAMRNGKEKDMKQSYKDRRDESRGMKKYEANMKNEKYMPNNMKEKVMGHEKQPMNIKIPEGQGYSEVKPYKPGMKGYPKEAYNYKY